ncbi:CoB--CoM heterodisulfide reductase iron-sulfur subunit B family protein [Candidatus Latescibacterota bacterium]
MEKIDSKTAIYPGCSLEGTAAGFEMSLEKVLNILEADFGILDNWNCCGATSAHALNHTLYLALALRNLECAEKQGYDSVIAPCAACYNRLANANLKLTGEDGLRKKINEETDLNYSGNVRVMNVLDFLVNTVGLERIRAKVVRPLNNLKIVSYYGCLNTRVPRLELFDDVENPTSMDRIVKSLGAEISDWSYKTECCGASLFVTSEPVALKLSSKILKDAVAREADCIAVACPMCHNNLDSLQKDIRAKYGIPRPIPILFVTQLMGLAFGISESELKLDHAFVPFELSEKI